MIQDTEKIINGLAARLSGFPVAGHLSSEHFSQFNRENDMDDVWNGYFELSQDTMPVLYDNDVINNAFVLFLRHIYRSRPADFPALFAHVLLGLSGMTPGVLPLDELKKDLVSLGYSDRVIDTTFSAVTADEEDKKRRAGKCRVGE